MYHIVLVGNPGCGKSTLLNTLIGEPMFESGLSVRTGGTKKMQTVERGGVKYSDTPGLADVDTKEEAAHEITKALNCGDEIKLIYVMKLDAARLRYDDISTLKIILDSLEQAKVETARNYSIVVNMLSEYLLRQIAELFSNSKARFMEEYFQEVNQPKDIHLVKMDFSAMDRPNCILKSTADELRSFVERAPSMSFSAEVMLETRKYPEFLKKVKVATKKLTVRIPFCNFA